MLFSLEIFPLRLYLAIFFQFRITFSIFETKLLIDRNQIVEQQCIDSLVLIFWFHGYKKQVEYLRVFLHENQFHQMIPTEWEQASLGLLQCLTQRRHGNTYRNHIVFGIGHQCHHTKIKNRQEHLDVLLNLLRRQSRITIKFAIGFVHQIEDSLAIFVDIFGRSTLHNLQAILAHNDFGNTLVLVRNSIRNVNLEFYPIGFLLETELFHVLRIIREVIDSGHSTQLFETFYQHPFRIEISKTKRTYHFGHTTFLAPGLNCLEQSIGHFHIIDKIHPSETYFLFAPSVVGAIVQDSRNTSYQLTVLVC